MSQRVVITGMGIYSCIGKNKEEFALIEKTGIANLTDEQLKSMVEKYFNL